ncbi:MAG: cbb3-type cytochrome oxidase assembly protein CcoS [Planctomycetota bacterium]|nr:cbb3-type cytochrome oxidase assembly protein CcoS [Planctomycetota bacterium]
MISVYYVLVFGIMLLFGASIVWGLWWALRGGQFSDFQKGAQSVLDDDEPTLRPCDVFPDLREEYRKELARRANERKA